MRANATSLDDSLPLATVARVVAVAVAKLITGGGLSALFYRQMVARGKLTKQFLKDVGTLNKDLLLPCMIFANVAKGVTIEMVADLWVVPLYVLAVALSSLLTGTVAAWLTCTPRGLRPIVQTMVTFNNVIGLPLPLLMSLIDDVPQLRAAPESHTRGTSYLFLANVVFSILMWTTAGPLLALGKDAGAPATPVLSSSATRSDAPDAGSETALPPAVEMEAAAVGAGGSGAAGGAPPRRRSRHADSLRSCGRQCLPILNRPVLASLFGLLVGCTPLRLVLAADGAPLRMLVDGMFLLGYGAVPTVVFILGATLSK